MDQEKIGKFIASSRKVKKMTQEQLAERLGVTSKTISRWETGKYMPDISLLKPLSENLGITINDLLNGEVIQVDDLREKTEKNIVSIIDDTSRKVKRKNVLLIIVTAIFVCIIIAFLLLFDYMYYKPCKYKEGDTSKWEAYFPNHSAYEMGLNSKNMPVFKNPSMALKQAKNDYSDAIKILKNEFKLPPFSKYTYKSYKIYGWQIVSGSEMIKEQGRKLTSFLDIYENSFEHII